MRISYRETIRLCDCINVDRVKDIPCDYYGVMGVPITYLDKHDPAQFEILGMARPSVNGKKKYVRLLIRRKDTPGGACAKHTIG